MGSRKKSQGTRPGELVTSKDGRLVTEINKEFDRHGKHRRKKILVGSLTLDSVGIAAYGTHCSNFYQMGRDIKGYDFIFISPRRMAIDHMRNFCVEVAIKAGCEFLYFFDDDTVNDINVVGRLLPRMKEFNAISASYYVRGLPFNPMVFSWLNREKGQMKLYGVKAEKNIDKDGVLRKDVSGVGCGCTLFRVKDFTKIPYPWFKTGHGHTEDAWFFAQAHKYIKDYKVGMDYTIVCGHLLDPIFVDANNVALLRRFYKRLKDVGGAFQ